MVCEDRQLTEAQRVAGYQNQRTGVAQALRPFSGRPTLDNLLDYINRELVPAVRRTRDAVNDIYLPSVDNAPSANPLIYYFSTETGNADPTAGRIRLDASPENTATTIRVSETNARLADATPWLEVMAGGATSPLGVVTLSDAINPARFIRFDLDTMVDQGTYWDLGVTVIESSHDDPFVEGGGLVVSFIPGVASDGVTVPPGSLTPIGANTVIGNPTASSAAPTEIAVAENSVLGRAGAAGTGNIESITVPGTGTLTGEVVFLQSSSLRNHVRWSNFGLNALPLMSDNRFIGNISGATARPVYVDLGDLSSASIVYEVTGKTFVREELDGDVFAAQNDNETVIQPNVVDNTKLADMAAGRVKGRQIDAGTGDPVDLTGAELAENLRKDTVQTVSGVSGALNVTLNDDTTVLLIRTTADATLHSLSAGTGGGREIIIEHDRLSGSGNLTLAHNSGSATLQRLFLPNTQDIVMGQTSIVVVRDRSSFWRANERGHAQSFSIADDAVTNAKLADMAAGTVKGRQIDAGTGNPVDLTGLEVGELIRFGTAQTTTLSGGTTNDLTLGADVTVLQLGSLTGAQTLTGLTGGASGRLVFVESTAAAGNPITLASLDAGSSSANRFRTPGGMPVVLGFRESALLRWSGTNSDWRVINVARNSAANVLNLGTAGANIDNQARANDERIITLDPSANISLTGVAAGRDGDTLLVRKIANSNLVDLPDESTSSVAANRWVTSDGSTIRLQRADESALAVYENSRWNIVSPTPPFCNTPANVLGDFLVHDGLEWVTRSIDGDKGDITVASLGASFTIDNNAVTDAKLRQGAACSVIGRSANTLGNVADISASTNDRVLTRASDTLGFRQISNPMIADGTIELGKITGIGANTVIGNNTASTTNPTTISVGTNTVLGRQGGNLAAAQVATAQIADDAVTNAKLANMAQATVKGRADAAGTGDPTDLSASQLVDIFETELENRSLAWVGAPQSFLGGIYNSGPWRLDGVISPSLAADQNDWNPTGFSTCNVVRVDNTSGGVITLTGMAARSRGTVVMLVNISGAVDEQIEIESESASSTAANRIVHASTLLTLQPNDSLMLWYDGDSQRWRPINWL